MSSMGEYGSLLQLGFGIGAGLSVFQAPLKLRYEYLNTSINAQLKMTANTNSVKADDLHAKLSELYLSLGMRNDRISELQKPFLVCCLFGAALNWAVLIYASMYASHNVSHLGRSAVIFISVIYYIIIGLVLEIVVRLRLRAITKKFKAIQLSA